MPSSKKKPTTEKPDGASTASSSSAPHFSSESKSSEVSMLDESLIGAFIQEFTYTPYEFDADIIFDVARLRDFFSCWRAYGDTEPDILPAYIQRLSDYGYNRIVSSEGEPIIPVVRKARGGLPAEPSSPCLEL